MALRIFAAPLRLPARCLAGALFLLGGRLAGAPAVEASAEWQRILELDAGPAAKFKTREEARTAAVAHLDVQEKALRRFLAAQADSPHTFEAQMRLARLLGIRATFQNSEAARGESMRLLDELNRTAVGPQRVEVAFARITYQMRTMRPRDVAAREQLLTAARRFATENAADKRVPTLLAEVSTLFDRQPETQRSLVMEAQKLSSDPALAQRLGDDLKRLDLLGQRVVLRFANRQGQSLDLAAYRGRVVVLLFFAEFSPPSTEAIAAIQKASVNWPKESVQLLGVSLDSRPEELSALVMRENVAFPVAFDGKGWNGPLVRSFGINRLPTVWLIDQEGNLRSLNALEEPVEQVKALLRGGTR